jgi:phenylalanyl-tRNA synthetase beta chain
MRVSMNWLRTLADSPLSNEALGLRLTMAGLEVEETEAAAPPFSHVVVGHIVAMEKHPDADKLNVCSVDVGDGTNRQIVCGAPNAAVGLRVPCALPGAELPGGFQIKEAKLRGVQSQGMLCSAKELGISVDHGGLLELENDANGQPPKAGGDFRLLLDLDDSVITFKVTPNRADCLSMLGVAREVAGLTGVPLKAPEMKVPTVSLTEIVPVHIEAPDLCGRFSGRIIRGVNAKAPTPSWMKRRLERAGQRSISALVDISNYVMLELGRPSHVFDLDKIHGGLTVRWAKQGETLKLLNGQTVELTGDVGVIADSTGVESLAGIMGGDSTAVSLDTTSVYVEAAFWWPNAVAGRARRYNFATDASYRFERGVDFATTVQHADYISYLIQSICGGQCGPMDDQTTGLPKRDPVRMRLARADKIIGVQVQDPVGKLTKLGLDAKLDGDCIVVQPPSYRFDLNIEEDIIEELARLHGLENLPIKPPMASAVINARSGTRAAQWELRRAIARRDYMEVVNFSFVPSGLMKQLVPNDEPVKVLNPITDQMDVMRTSLWAGLILNAQHNLNRKAERIRLFEIGRSFHRNPAAKAGPLAVEGFDQPWRLAMLAMGPLLAEQWGAKTSVVDFFDLKGDFEALLGGAVRTVKASNPCLHPGQSAQIEIDGQACGWIGALHPALVQSLELPFTPVLLECLLDPVIARKLTAYKDISKFPAVTRDLALVVSDEIAAQTVLDEIKKYCGENSTTAYVTNVILFDEYRGKGLENKEKSLAFRVLMQDTSKTLSDQEIDLAVSSIIEAMRARVGAKLRS